jgi:hypothetical protein
MTIFRKGEFQLYSGRTAEWNIDCGNLSDEDWECIRDLILERFPNFSKVDYAARSGEKLRDLLTPFSTSGDILLVNDVLDIQAFQDRRLWYRTRANYHNKEIIGYVVFAMMPCPNWVRALWQLDVRLNTWEAPI